MRLFGEDVRVSFAGCSNLCIVADDLIIPGQLRSLAIALVVVGVLLVAGFRSIRLGLLGLAPLLVTITVVFGLMSAFGVMLDAVTALIASMVLGIGIDYSIHFLTRYREARGMSDSASAACAWATEQTGPAIVFNSIAVSVAFSVLLFSSFWPVKHIGWIVAATMVIAALLTLMLVPAALVLSERVGGGRRGDSV